MLYLSCIPRFGDEQHEKSTRLVIYAASLIAHGTPVDQAIETAMIEPLTDDDDVKEGLRDIVTAVFG